MLSTKTLVLLSITFLSTLCCTTYSADDRQSKFLKAIYHHDILTVQLCLTNGADVNNVDELGRTPLMYSLYDNTKHNSYEIVRLLLEHGADVNARDEAGRTVLHKAALYREAHVIPLLIRYGAKVGIIDNYGEMPIHRAVAAKQYAEWFLITKIDLDNQYRSYKILPEEIRLKLQREIKYATECIELLEKASLKIEQTHLNIAEIA